MRTLFGAQVLAADIPSHVHQLDSIERAAAAPRCRRRMCRGAVERVFDRNQPAGATHLAPAGFQVVPDMGEQHRVHAIEQTVADLECLAGQQLFGDAGPQHQRAGQALVLHQLFQRQRGGDIHRLAGVVALAVPGTAFHQRFMIRDARLLRNVRQRIGVAAERNDRSAGAPRRDPSVGMPATPRFTLKP